jgi:hypothetical protein
MATKRKPRKAQVEPQGDGWQVHSDGCGQVWSPAGLVAVVHTGDESDPRVDGGSGPHGNNPAHKDAYAKVQANAALIAAAPDLLAAAQAALLKLNAMDVSGSYTRSDAEAAELRQAVAKARQQ